MRAILFNFIGLNLAVWMAFLAGSLLTIQAADFPLKGTSVGSVTLLGQPPVVNPVTVHHGIFSPLFPFDTLVAEEKANLATIPITLTDGKLTLTTSWGDKIECSYTGSVSPGIGPGELYGNAPFTVTNGTGIFVGAKGQGLLNAVVTLTGPTNGISSYSWEGNLNVPNLIACSGVAGAAITNNGPSVDPTDALSVITRTFSGAGLLSGLGHFVLTGSENVDLRVTPPPFPVTAGRATLLFADGASLQCEQDGAGIGLPDVSDPGTNWTTALVSYRIASGSGRLAGATGRLNLSGSMRASASGANAAYSANGLIRLSSSPAIVGATLLPDRSFRFEVAAPLTSGAQIEGSANLQQWQLLGPATPNAAGKLEFIDRNAAAQEKRIYRARLE